MRCAAGDCLTWCHQRGIHPPRSACVGCPMHLPAEWRRDVGPRPSGRSPTTPPATEPLRSLEIEATRAGGVPRGPVYLHRSGRPLNTPGLLDNAEDRGQLTLFGGDDGWCGL